MPKPEVAIPRHRLVQVGDHHGDVVQCRIPDRGHVSENGH
jgi:hypothetical protein